MALGTPTAKRQRVFESSNRNDAFGGNYHQISATSTTPLPQMKLFKKLQAERENLPVYSVKDEILREISKSPTLILIGETGSGKTTQIPQFIYEEEFHGDGVIGVTQPRRIAAVSLSMRVAQEKGVALGSEVGYSVRFDTVASDETKILYQTDGMLLREAIIDPLLERYSVIILDEAHERTLHTDVLFAVVKEAQAYRKKGNRPPLNVIIMSASMDVDHFSAYFDHAPVVFVEGRQYPIKLFYVAENSSDYIHDTIVSIFQLHQQAPVDHGILAFLTGQDEIDQVVRKCRSVAKELPPNSSPIMFIPLYAAMSPEAQMKVFDSFPNMRKVVIATNIAETSLTIPGIRLVIDSGKVKSRIYEPAKCIDMLRVGMISKAQACQRTGRAGREASGSCYRLYTEETYENLNAHTTPEIKRCNLAGIILELLSMRIPDIKNFDFLDKPSDQALDAAVKELVFLGAVDEISEPTASSSTSSPSSLLLTPLGSKMSRFALDPKLSRMLLASAAVVPACTAEMLSVVAILSADSFLLSESVKRQELESARRKYFTAEGDLLTLLNIYRAYQKAKSEGKARQWCQEHFINYRMINTVDQIREQLKETCERLDIPVEKSCGQDKKAVRRAISYGLFMNAAELDPNGKDYHLVESGVNAQIHPSSFLFQQKPGCVVFSELMLTSQLYIRDLTVVEPKYLFDAAPEYFKQKHVKLG